MRAGVEQASEGRESMPVCAAVLPKRTVTCVSRGRGQATRASTGPWRGFQPGLQGFTPRALWEDQWVN